MIAKSDQGIVVVPWDFSSQSRAGLDHALEMTKNSELIHVVHVAAPLAGPDNGALYEAAENRKRIALKRRFKDQIAGDSNLSSVHFHVAFGHVGFEIARFADHHQAELIVVPAPKKRPFQEFIFGGMAKQVVSHARRPVLVVQGDDSTAKRHPQSNGIDQRLGVCLVESKA